MRPLLFALKNVGFAAYLILFLTACFLLFASPDEPGGIGLEFAPPFDRRVLMVALIACATAYATYLAWIICKFIGTALDRRRRRNALMKTLLNLSGEEKQLIREFIRDDKTSVYASRSDQAAKRLDDKAIIYRTSLLLAPGQQLHYSLEPAIREFLKEHPALLAPAPIPFDKEDGRIPSSTTSRLLKKGLAARLRS
jgi:Super-infection exclusion protein B